MKLNYIIDQVDAQQTEYSQKHRKWRVEINSLRMQVKKLNHEKAELKAELQHLEKVFLHEINNNKQFFVLLWVEIKYR